MGRKKDKALALTTDTGASVVNNATIALMESVGSAYLASGASPGSAFYYNATMGFMVNVVLNLGFLEGAPVSLWDAVTALILLGKKSDAQDQWLDTNVIALCVCGGGGALGIIYQYHHWRTITFWQVYPLIKL
jgi:hypothetical protein